MIEDDVESIELLRISAVMSEDARGEGALERCKAEHSLTIVPQHELVQAVAQSADAVVEDDGVKRGHNIDFSIQRSQQPRPFDQGSGQALRPGSGRLCPCKERRDKDGAPSKYLSSEHCGPKNQTMNFRKLA
jgi:hypothetical protein